MPTDHDSIVEALRAFGLTKAHEWERGVNRSCRQMGQQHQFQLAQAEPKFGSTSEVVYVVVCSRCGEVRRQEAAQ